MKMIRISLFLSLSVFSLIVRSENPPVKLNTLHKIYNGNNDVTESKNILPFPDEKSSLFQQPHFTGITKKPFAFRHKSNIGYIKLKNEQHKINSNQQNFQSQVIKQKDISKKDKPNTIDSLNNASTAEKLTLDFAPRSPIVHIYSRQLGDDGSLSDRMKFKNILHPKPIEFTEVPEGDPYLSDLSYTSPNLGLGSAIVSYIQPNNISTDLIEATLQKEINVEDIFKKFLSTEPWIVCILLSCGLLTILTPVVGISLCICRVYGSCLCHHSQQKYGGTPDPCRNCHRRSLTTVLALFSLLLLLGISLAILSNESLSRAVKKANPSLKNNVQDVNTYMTNTKMQLKFLVTNSLEQTVEAVYADLDNVQAILGQPLQEELASEANINPALDALIVISSGLGNIAHKMRNLETLRVDASRMAEEVATELQDLKTSLDNFIIRCPVQDKHLCLTLDTYGLNVMVDFDTISFSDQLRLIAVIESHNLTETARNARYEFNNIPVYVDTMTRMAREDVKRAIQGIRSNIYAKIGGVDDLAYNVEEKTKALINQAEDLIAHMEVYEPIRYYVTLGVWISLSLTWILVTFGTMCGCCVYRDEVPPWKRSTVSHSSGQTIICSVGLIFLLSTILWAVVLVLFFFGSHAHCIICRPLYDDLSNSSLSKIMTKSGILVDKESGHDKFVQQDYQANVTIGEILQQCEKGKTAYQVFQVKNLFDMDSEIYYNTLLETRTALEQIKVNLTQVRLLTPGTEGQLKVFLRAANIDISPYRRQLEKSLIGKNMPIFTEQMEKIAGQVSARGVANELNKLVQRSKQFIVTTLYPLEKKKEDLAYQIATLDMDLMPLQRQINQSSSQLKNIQEFIHYRGTTLAATKVRGYQERLLSYTRQYTEHIKATSMQTMAPCTPLWQVFDSARSLLCNGIISPVNELWLSLTWCLILFIPVIGLGLSLSSYYIKRVSGEESLQIMNEHDSENNICENTNEGHVWATAPPSPHNTGGHHHDVDLPPDIMEDSCPQSPRRGIPLQDHTHRHITNPRQQNGQTRIGHSHPKPPEKHW